MCIICHKPEGVSLPSKETLRTCFINNPDGAGFMLRDPDTGLISGNKGYMRFKKLYAALATLGDIKDLDMVIHFRIGTHGLMDKSATHPFPASKELNDLAATAWTSQMGIAHNGVIRGFGDTRISDTQEFIQGYLNKMIRAVHLEEIRELIADITTGSKWVFMTARGETYRIGQFIESDGCYYSNSDFQRVPVAGYTYSAWASPGRWNTRQGNLFKKSDNIKNLNTCPLGAHAAVQPDDCMRQGCSYFDVQAWECGAGLTMPYWEEM
jgi:hypothetical protein